jgi:hypothetical protein
VAKRATARLLAALGSAIAIASIDSNRGTLSQIVASG